MKKFLAKLKYIIDTYKMWIFIVAIFGTNGAQMYANSEIAEPVASEKVVVEPIKTIIIHKVDNSYCDKKINEHENGSRH